MTEHASTPAVLVHGVGLDRHMWSPFAALLGREVITYDLIGLGDAPKPDGPYSLSLYAEQLLHVIDGRCVDLIGFSLGSLIAQRFAIDHPQHVRRLILVSGVFDRSETERAAIRERVSDVRAGGYLQSIDAALHRWFTPEFAATRPDVVATIRDRMHANDPVPYSYAYEVFAEGDAELVHAVSHITCPTLVVTGGADERSTPEMSRRLAATIPSAQVAILDDVKHLLPLEAPDRLAETVTAFLDDDNRRTGAGA
jgi:(E)-2-((N-methylformamido)methylene)succinate hydrolase